MQIVMVGAGGNGSKLLVSLVRAQMVLNILGRNPLQLVLIDPDTVSEANLVRQAFLPGDLGRPKAEVLVSRVNLAYGLNWEWRARAFRPADLHGVQLVISAVDSRQARRAIAEAIGTSVLWWLDMGNDVRHGQVLLGRGTAQMPYPHERLPELVEGEDDDRPSCSALEAVMRQDLLVNDMAAIWAAELAWQVIKDGKPKYLGVFFDLERGTVRSIPTEVVCPTGAKTNSC